MKTKIKITENKNNVIHFSSCFIYHFNVVIICFLDSYVILLHISLDL